jgi:hypothetical protein
VTRPVLLQGRREDACDILLPGDLLEGPGAEAVREDGVAGHQPELNADLAR